MAYPLQFASSETFTMNVILEKRMQQQDCAKPELKRTLGAFHLWGIAVGLVISGEYFGWSYGWAQAGTMGFLVTSLLVAAMYTAFIF